MAREQPARVQHVPPVTAVMAFFASLSLVFPSPCLATPLPEYVEDPRGEMGTAFGGRLGIAVPGHVPVDQRRGVDRDAREVERSHQKDWSKMIWAEGCWSW